MKLTIDKIKKEISPLIEGFLNSPDYLDRFKDLAFSLGEESEQLEDIQIAMFTVQGKQIGFVATEVYDWFIEWQLLDRLKGKEPFSTLLTIYPDRKEDILTLAKKMLDGEEVTEKDMSALFEGLEYDDG